MKKILTLVLLFTAVVAFGQQSGTQTDSKYGPYLTNGFWDNWFVSAGAGTQVYFGEFDKHADLGKRLGIALDVSLGKWLTPNIGLRVQYSGLNAFGAAPSLTPYNQGTFSNTGDYRFREKFEVTNLHGDVLWNISNTISGYKADRLWDFIPFAGAGYTQSWKLNSDHNKVRLDCKEVGLTLGLLNQIRLSSALDLNLELKTLFVNDRFDKVEIGEGIEELATATVGFTYNFPKRTFDRPEKPIVPDYTPYTSKISDLERQIAESDAAAKELADELNAERNKKAQTVTKIEYLNSPLAIFFPINKSKLTDKDLINLANFAEWAKKSGNKYKILGSADKETGNKRINKKLSQDRANHVYDALVNKFGVNPNQLEVIAKGDENEPFDKPVLNRVVILE